MRYLTGPPEKSLIEIDNYISKRLKILSGKDKSAVLLEFKEWLIDQEEFESDNIWAIPDLTDDGLREFFQRVIADKRIQQ